MAGDVQAVCVLEEEACWLQLEDFRMLLIKTIEPSRITPYLRQCQVISPEDEEQIFNDPVLVIRRRKVGVLLDILQRSGLKGYTAFLESLELDYPQLYSRITGKEPNRTFSILVDTAGDRGLTEFLMSEVSSLQRALQEEKRRRQAACSVAKDQEESSRQQQLRDREVRKLSERVQKVREERDRLSEEVKQLREHNYILMTNINALSDDKNSALLANRDLQLEIEKLKHSLLSAESANRLARHRTVTLRSAMEQRPSQEALLSLQRHNALLSERVKEMESRKLSPSQHNGAKEEEKKGEEVKKEEEKKEERQLDLLSTVFKLRRELHQAEEERNRTQDQMEELVLRYSRLKGDAKMYRQRNEQTLRQLEEVSKERDKAMSSRSDLHAESTVYLQEKDQYREQVRQLTERCDWQQLQLLRSKGEVLQLQTRVRRLTCSTHQSVRSQSASSEETERTEGRAKASLCPDGCTPRLTQPWVGKRAWRRSAVRGVHFTSSSDDIPSGTSGENEEAAALQCHQSPLDGAAESGQQPSTDAAWEDELSDCWRPRSRCHRNFFYRRKRAVRSKVIGMEHAPCNLDDSSGSDTTDSDGR